MLGEKIEAKIEAKYYFGSPVVNAKVKYKIERTSYSQNWYPHGPWDWFYGSGYWWFAPDYAWYPGWGRWVGCVAPMPWWWHGGYNPPELVAENEVQIGPDGTLAVEIDTAVAKELFGDTDHQYTITAEVRDESRRTIVGNGKVLVAREPFKVYSWVDRGYYRTGDTIAANFQAQTLDSKPVEGKGQLTLHKITYKEVDGQLQPVETPVRRWDLDTNVEGQAQQQMRASASGQYRLSYLLTDEAGHKIEGGYVFTIMGEGYDGQEFRFNELELIPNKQSYAAGDKVELQINANLPNSTVLLFVRPTNGIYLAPKVIHMMGKSHVEEITVSKKDMPNFYVEAVTVSGGKIYQQVKELVVPPEKRVVNVEVLPSATEYLPGAKADVKLKLTNLDGSPFVGSTTVTMYDKSLEYISGGSNVGDIREFFWKWRRHHQPQQETSLARWFHNMTRPGETGMGHVGVFGATLAAELDAVETRATGGPANKLKNFSGRGQGGGLGGVAFGNNRLAVAEAAAAPPAPGAFAARANSDAVAMDAGGVVEKKASHAGPGGGGGAPDVQPTIRTNFADSAFWKADLRTNDEGIAEFSLDMPENLTGWKVKVWGMGHGTKVGAGETEVVTRKNIILRLQAPRFFVQKDEVVLSANVHNYLKTAKEVTVSLEMPSEVLEPMTRDELVQKITIAAGGEQRVDWRVKVRDEGQAVVRMKSLTDEESDAMEMTFPAYVHGMLKQEAWAGTVRPDDQRGQVTLRVPAERRAEQTVLEVRYSPTLAAAMVDALPYMLDYPYGCTEQTLNRFLPAVITQKTLTDMGISLEDVQKKRTNLNAQEIGDDAERAKQWKRLDRNPVFDKKELDDIVAAGVTRLANMQVGDGGWGWFSGHGERSWPHTTAVVVHGLQQARAADVTLPDGMLDRGVAWLKRYQEEEVVKLKNAAAEVKPWKNKADNLDALVYMVLADAGQKNVEMMEFLYRDRTDLAVYGKSMFGLALVQQDEPEKLTMILKNIEQFLIQDAENESAWLKLPDDNAWWYWYGSEVEADAWYLKLLAATDAKGVAAPRMVKYLLNNRKHGTYWNSTRDTAYCVEAFAAYIRASGELEPDMVVEIFLDGAKQKEIAINKENIFSFDNK
ncbi:MAG: alpha-2-macroglobulin, partial [Planctomycetales bacterium]|nr:alpha-2-macroglobulin [Planctomycetales bacterium]